MYGNHFHFIDSAIIYATMVALAIKRKWAFEVAASWAGDPTTAGSSSLQMHDSLPWVEGPSHPASVTSPIVLPTPTLESILPSTEDPKPAPSVTQALPPLLDVRPAPSVVRALPVRRYKRVVSRPPSAPASLELSKSPSSALPTTSIEVSSPWSYRLLAQIALLLIHPSDMSVAQLCYLLSSSWMYPLWYVVWGPTSSKVLKYRGRSSSLFSSP